MYPIHIVVMMVQIGTNLWVNPMQVTEIKQAPRNEHPKCLVEVIVVGGSVCSDWSIERVKAALEERGK